jgi:hypothetical protein
MKEMPEIWGDGRPPLFPSGQTLRNLLLWPEGLWVLKHGPASGTKEENDADEEDDEEEWEEEEEEEEDITDGDYEPEGSGSSDSDC